MIRCDDPSCYNFNQVSPMYCDKCIKEEIDKMSYQEVVDLYIEGKEWLDQMQPVEDEASREIIDKFKSGWFSILNIALLSKGKDEEK